MSASCDGDSIPWTACARSSGAPGASCRTSCACVFSATKRASIAFVSGSAWGMTSIRAARNGSIWTYSFTRKRMSPWQIAWCRPSGAVQ